MTMIYHDKLNQNYIILSESGPYADMFYTLFKDLLDYPQNKFITSYWNEKSSLRNKLFTVLYKNKVNNILNNSFEYIIKPQYSLEEALQSFDDKPVCVIFNNSSLKLFYNYKNLKQLKDKYPNSKFVLYFVDSVFQPTAQRAFSLTKTGIFDLIYTYSKYDAKKYNFIYFPTPYSKTNINNDNLKNGVYFCGGENGRTELLKSIAKKLALNHISYKFDVIGNPKSSNQYFMVKDTKKNIESYPNILAKTLKYSCILDLVQMKSKDPIPGLSLRAYEALVYDRVLITNNPQILNFKYYNPKTMHYIKSENDINLSWISQKVQNHYKNQFSPIKLAEDIENRLSLRSKNDKS